MPSAACKMKRSKASIFTLLRAVLVLKFLSASFALAGVEDVPVVGVGIGNLEHENIKEVIEMGVNEFGIRMIDTAMASRNHHLIGKR